VKHTKRAEVYRTTEFYIVHPWSKVSTGGSVATQPYLTLPLSVSDENLGEAILAALGAAKVDLALPSDWNALQKSLRNAAGVKSWAAFMEGSRAIFIEDDGSSLTFVPEKSTGSRGGFQESDAEGFSLPIGSAEEDIGRTTESTLERAE
jgi:hypothetical protein